LTETIAVTSSQVTGSGTTTITINPGTDFIAGISYMFMIPNTAFKDAAGNHYVGNDTGFMADLPDPTKNKEFVASIEAQTNIAVNAMQDSFTPISNRMRWLRQHKGSKDLSHQGIKIGFANEWVDRLINAQSTPAVNNINSRQLLGLAQKYSDDPDYILDDLQTTLTDSAVNKFAMVKEDVLAELFWRTGGDGFGLLDKPGGLNLNPTGSIDETWAIWTEGNLTFGKTDASASSSRQEGEAKGITVGIDRYVGDNGLIGLAVRGGEEDTDIGSNGTRVEAEGYNVSVYGVLSDLDLFPGLENMIVEGIIGVGHINMDLVRMDDNNVALVGVRRVNQINGSLTFRGNMDYEGFKVYPYGKVDASYTQLNEYNEQGSNFALHYDDQIVEYIKLYVGVDLDYAMRLGSGILTPYGRLEYGADVSSKSNADMHYVIDGSTSYTLVLENRSRSNLKMGVGVNYQHDVMSFSVKYERVESFGVGYSNSLNLVAGFRF
jgi:hypothetical protein